VYKKTTACTKIRQLRKPITGIQGGTGAGKTTAILINEIDHLIRHPLTETSFVSESVPHLKRGGIKDFKKIMKTTGRWNPLSWHGGDKKYTFYNGSYLEFFGADDDSKLRGARRNRLIMNEANNMPFKVYTELASRTDQKITMDWNPTHKFWFHRELMEDPDVDFLILTWLDNELCPDRTKDFILKAKFKAAHSTFWKNWYQVYGLGQIGSLEGVVFQNWDTIDSVPEGAKLLCYGLDFGFTNDPTAIVALYKWNNYIILDEVLYRNGLLNSQIAHILKKENKRTVWADSAEPKSIKEIKRYGLDIRGAKKGKDSIMYGINLMQEKKFLITKRSANLIEEFNNYTWQVNKEGDKINKPIDDFNHGIDAIRYGAVSELSNKKPYVRARAQ
jgi:phage terminase large subunit